LVLLIPGWHASLHAQDTHRAMYVSVVDKDGKPVEGLTPRDFTVREDGVAREVLHVEPATTPFTLALLVDTSQAAGPYMQDIRPAVEGFIKTMADGQNEIALIGLGDRPTILQDYTTSQAQLEKAAQKLFASPQSGAYFLDALSNVSTGLKKRNPQRAAVLAIITEGPDFSTPQPDYVIDGLQASHASLNVLVMGPPARNILNEAVRSRNEVIGRGTRETGGRVDHILTGTALRLTLGHMSDDLTHQYLVTYAHPESLIPPKAFTVSVKRPGLTARGTPVPQEGRP
jgi:VWFA-related protein